MRAIGIALLALCLAACGTAKFHARTFAPPPTAVSIALPVDVLIAPVDAKTDFLVNEVLYRNAGEPALHAYAGVYWQAPPADQLRDALHAASGGTLTILDAKPQRAHCALSINIAAYDHVRDGTQHYAEIRLNYALMHLNSREKLADGSLDIKAPSQTNDAQGAADALNTASQDAVLRLLEGLKKTFDNPEKLRRCSTS